MMTAAQAMEQWADQAATLLRDLEHAAFCAGSPTVYPRLVNLLRRYMDLRGLASIECHSARGTCVIERHGIAWEVRPR